MRLTGIEKSRSYATEANLLNVIKDWPNEWRFLVVRVANGPNAGRYTAVFQGASLGGNIAAPAHAGFMVI